MNSGTRLRVGRRLIRHLRTERLGSGDTADGHDPQQISVAIPFHAGKNSTGTVAEHIPEPKHEPAEKTAISQTLAGWEAGAQCGTSAGTVRP